MKLIDTSAWIESLRSGGDPSVSTRVRALLESGEAAWCPLVRLELWNGARGGHEKCVLQDMEKNLPDLPITAATWDLACELARQAREQGHTIPAPDILIAACAHENMVAIEHVDPHFDILAGL